MLLPRQRGNIFFPLGATARHAWAALVFARVCERKVSDCGRLHSSAARGSLAPNNIHVAHLVIDSSVDTQWVRQLDREAREGAQAIEKPRS